MSNDSSGSAGELAFPLSTAAAGDRLVITALKAGKGLGRRLADLGLPVGTEIEVVHRQHGGRLVVARQMSRVALGASMTQKIMVTHSNGTGADETDADGNAE